MDQDIINTDEIVKDLKVTFFDIAGQNQKVMDRIESFLSKEKDPQKVEELQNLWAQFHEAGKTFLTNVENLSTTLYNLEIYSQDFEAFVDEKRTEMIEAVNNQKDYVENETIDENYEEEVVQEPVSEEVVEENANEEVVEEPVSEQIVEETTNEEAAPEVASEQVVEETTNEEAAPEVVSEQTVEENTNEEVTPEAVSEETTEDNKDSSALEEVKIEESPIPEAISELTDSIVSKENSNDVASEEPALIAESSPKPEENSEKAADLPTIILPVVEEENNAEKQSDDATQSVMDMNSSDSVVDTPSSSSDEEIPTISEDEALVFHKGMLAEDKAILVSVSQAANLRSSLPKQKELFEQSYSSSQEENVSPAQLEEMMNQLSELYSQGKTEEAELMSEKIRVLNKQMTPAA